MPALSPGMIHVIDGRVCTTRHIQPLGRTSEECPSIHHGQSGVGATRVPFSISRMRRAFNRMEKARAALIRVAKRLERLGQPVPV